MLLKPNNNYLNSDLNSGSVICVRGSRSRGGFVPTEIFFISTSSVLTALQSALVSMFGLDGHHSFFSSQYL